MSDLATGSALGAAVSTASLGHGLPLRLFPARPGLGAATLALFPCLHLGLSHVPLLYLLEGLEPRMQKSGLAQMLSWTLTRS